MKRRLSAIAYATGLTALLAAPAGAQMSIGTLRCASDGAAGDALICTFSPAESGQVEERYRISDVGDGTASGDLQAEWTVSAIADNYQMTDGALDGSYTVMQKGQPSLVGGKNDTILLMPSQGSVDRGFRLEIATH